MRDCAIYVVSIYPIYCCCCLEPQPKYIHVHIIIYRCCVCVCCASLSYRAEKYQIYKRSTRKYNRDTQTMRETLLDWWRNIFYIRSIQGLFLYILYSEAQHVCWRLFSIFPHHCTTYILTSVLKNIIGESIKPLVYIDINIYNRPPQLVRELNYVFDRH
jgi:hypothetical protein